MRASVGLLALGTTLLYFTGVGSAQVRLELDSLSANELRLRWPADGGQYQLEQAEDLRAPVQWFTVPGAPFESGGNWFMNLPMSGASRFFRLGALAGPVEITRLSPSPGESGVSVNRETIVEFSRPLSAGTLLTGEELTAEAGGRRLLTRVHLSPDRTRLTLFLQEPMPGNARVRVRVDGDRLQDAAGLGVDVRGDGVAGGQYVWTFDTAATEPVGETAIIGWVYASEIAAGPDGAVDQPLEGVTITVDGKEEQLRTTTGSDGFFKLQPAPVGRVFVHVDGRTATGSAWPGGAYYPLVGKAWHAEAGRTNNLAGGTGLVYLPRIPAQTLQPVSLIEDTVVTFAPSVLAEHPELEGVRVTVPANSLFSDSGTRGGQVGLAPVASDRLPEPLPDGLEFPLVFTLQTDGPTNFDQPVPVRFPNMPDPVTGELLPPGAQTALWSFDHDTGRWDVQGTMTVTADGRFVESDPGVGIRQPGWHGANPGSQTCGPKGRCSPRPPRKPDCQTCNEDSPEDEPDCNGSARSDCKGKDKDDCRDEKLDAGVAGVDLLLDLVLIPLEAPPIIGCAISGSVGGMRSLRDCAVKPDDCESSVAVHGGSAALGCIPGVGGFLSAGVSTVFAGYAYGKLGLCALGFGGNSTPSLPSLYQKLNTAVITTGFWDQNLERIIVLIEQQLELGQVASALLTAIYGGVAWRPPDNLPDLIVYQDFMKLLTAALEEQGPGGTAITESERTALLSAPLPTGVTTPDVEQLVARMERFAAGQMSEAERQNMVAEIDHFVSLLEAREAEGWTSMISGYYKALELYTGLTEPRVGSAEFPLRAHYYALRDLEFGAVRYGRLSNTGELDPLIIAPNRYYAIFYVEPETARVGAAVFQSSPTGQLTRVPAAPLFDYEGVDSDGDGLPDLIEHILGSDPFNPDSSGDGIPDGVAFAAGLHPVHGESPPTGIVGALRLPGNADYVAVDGDVAAVGLRTSGVAFVDIRDHQQPVLLSTVPFPQFTVRTLAYRNNLVLVGGNAGANFIDASDPAQPVAGPRFFSSSVTAVALGPEEAWVGSGSTLYKFDSNFGIEMGRVQNPGAAVHDIQVAGDVVWVLTSSELRSYDRETLALLASLQVAGTASPRTSRRRLFVGGDRAYAGYFQGFAIINIANPSAPAMLAVQPQTQAAMHSLAAAGEGILTGVSSFLGTTTLAFSWYDVGLGNTTTNFIGSITTPGIPWETAMHRGGALVADEGRGLQLLRFQPMDFARRPPTVRWGARILEPGFAFETSTINAVPVNAQDDVQVSHVEIYLDGERVGFDVAFPFEPWVRMPAWTPGLTSVTIRARAVDTGGNEAWTEPLTVALEDTRPPRLLGMQPRDGFSTDRVPVRRVTTRWNEPLDLDNLSSNVITLLGAGPDGRFGTADDVVHQGSLHWDEETLELYMLYAEPLPTGAYRINLAGDVQDLSGNFGALSHTSSFEILPPSIVGFYPTPVFKQPPNLVSRAEIRFGTPLQPSTLSSETLRIISAGSDGRFGTQNDSVLPLERITYDAQSGLVSLHLPAPLPPGLYRISVEPGLKGLAGNSVVRAVTSDFEVVPGPSQWANPAGGNTSVAANWDPPVRPNGHYVLIDLGGAGLHVTNNTTMIARTVTNTASLRINSALTVGEALHTTGPLDVRAVLEAGSFHAGDSVHLQSTLRVAGPARLLGPLTSQGTIRFEGGGLFELMGGAVFPATTIIQGAALELHGGEVNRVSGGTVQVNTGGRFEVKPGAVFETHSVHTGTDVGPRFDVQSLEGEAPGEVRIGGVLRKTGSGRFSFAPRSGQQFSRIANHGRVDVEEGILRVSGTILDPPGLWNIAEEALVEFRLYGSLPPQVAGPIQWEGDGTVLFAAAGSQGGLRLPGHYGFPGTTQIQSHTIFGGSVGPIGTLEVHGRTTFENAPEEISFPIMLGGGATSTQGILELFSDRQIRLSKVEMSPAGTHTIRGAGGGDLMLKDMHFPAIVRIEDFRSVHLTGQTTVGERTTSVSSSDLHLFDETIVSGTLAVPRSTLIHPNARLTLDGAARVSATAMGGELVNRGTIRKSGPGTATLTTSTSSSLFGATRNHGVVEILEGTLGFSVGIYEQHEGQTILNGNRLEVAPLLLGGEFLGPGTLNRAIENVAGVVRFAGPPGVLNTQGYIQAPEGTLFLRLGGTVAGETHDQIVSTIGTAVFLEGKLSIGLINGFTPQLGEEFVLIRGSIRAERRFDELDFPPLPAGRQWELDYASNQLVLRVVPQ